MQGGGVILAPCALDLLSGYRLEATLIVIARVPLAVGWGSGKRAMPRVQSARSCSARTPATQLALRACTTSEGRRSS